MLSAKRKRKIQELIKLQQQSGRGIIAPATVVRVARDPKNVLHDEFEWDDAKAGHQHRLWQARHLITVFQENIGTEAEPVMSQIFVSMKSDRHAHGGYRTQVEVLSDDVLREQFLDQAFRELEAFKEKFGRLVELAGIFKAVVKAQQRRKSR